MLYLWASSCTFEWTAFVMASGQSKCALYQDMALPLWSSLLCSAYRCCVSPVSQDHIPTRISFRRWHVVPKYFRTRLRCEKHLGLHPDGGRNLLTKFYDNIPLAILVTLGPVTPGCPDQHVGTRSMIMFHLRVWLTE